MGPTLIGRLQIEPKLIHCPSRSRRNKQSEAISCVPRL